MIQQRLWRTPPPDGVMLGYVSTTADIDVARAIAGRAGDLWEVHLPARSPVLLLAAAEATEHPQQTRGADRPWAQVYPQ